MEEYGYCSCKTLGMKEVPKALTVNQTEGLIKMAVDPKNDNRIVGVHILESSEYRTLIIQCEERFLELDTSIQKYT